MSNRVGIGIFFAGVLMATLVFIFVPKFLRFFLGKTRLIKRYWTFVAIFSILSIMAYWVVLRHMKGESQVLAINVVGQILPLVFAIFVGYFAFVQVMESRKEKFDEQGLIELRAKRYSGAIKYWRDAHSIGPKDPSTLSNLMEVYLITGDYNELSRRMPLLKKVSQDSRVITYHYLSVMMDIFRGRLTDARKSIGETVAEVQKTPDIYDSYAWGFVDIENSESFKKLTGEAKKLANNYLGYLKRNLSVEEKRKFEEEKDFLLQKPSEPEKAK